MLNLNKKWEKIQTHLVQRKIIVKVVKKVETMTQMAKLTKIWPLCKKKLHNWAVKCGKLKSLKPKWERKRTQTQTTVTNWKKSKNNPVKNNQFSNKKKIQKKRTLMMLNLLLCLVDLEITKRCL